MSDEIVLLAHGAGGRKSAELINNLFLKEFDNEALSALGDAAVFDAGSGRLAVTTDSFVVSPLFFPGGDIGKLAVCGSVNDLASMGAKPVALSAAFIIEEGLEISVLEKVVASMRSAAAEAGVRIVTGDTKVVARGSADQLFITTSGIGVISKETSPAPNKACIGDVVIVSGTIGDHGMAVMTAREGIEFATQIRSDCAPLYGMVQETLAAAPNTHTIRDATRGGVSAVLNELACQSSVCIEIEESRLPIREDVSVACELLGIDPLHVANEGKMVFIVPGDEAESALEAMKRNPYGSDAAIIGTVVDGTAGRVQLRTEVGSLRILDMPAGDLLPRIC